MDGDSSVLASSGEAVATAAEVTEAHEGAEDGGGGGGAGSNSAEEDKGFKDIEEGDKNFGGNRWPRHETLALLKIRSDMDAVFRDSTHKAPLWDEVSRKLAELGYNRSAKKCKEKFENVYKYHKRTKEIRSGKSNNNKKVYRYSDELEALDNHHISFQSHHPSSIPQSTALAYNPPWTVPQKISTVPSPINPTKTAQNSHFVGQININSTTFPSNSLPPKCDNPLSTLPNMSANVIFPSSTSSSTASDEDPFRRQRRKRKRKWADFFVRLTKEVIEKQEGLQLKFLEALERIENQRKLRDEAWRMKEVTRVNREHEILVQEMSMAAAKDAAVVAFLQKITPQSNTGSPQQPLPLPPPPPLHPTQTVNLDTIVNMQNGGNNGIITTLASSSRWPKAEVEALIRLRTELELKYQDNGPKGPLWEDISAAMAKLGHNRSAKRCKEKWENINKYFKKVKDSNKKRPEDSKTCPYFHQLDALYREKLGKNSFDINNQMEPLMVEPEQQWPPPLQANQIMGNIQRTNSEENQEQDGEEEEDRANSSTDVEDREEEDGGSSFEMVTSEQSPVSISNTV